MLWCVPDGLEVLFLHRQAGLCLVRIKFEMTTRTRVSRVQADPNPLMGASYLFIANFFATQIIGGTKELVIL
jgi:hypothetical protein